LRAQAIARLARRHRGRAHRGRGHRQALLPRGRPRALPALEPAPEAHLRPPRRLPRDADYWRGGGRLPPRALTSAAARVIYSVAMATTFDSKPRRVSKEDALEYHAGSRRGKIEVVPTKPVVTARDLALAYTP